MRTVGYIPPKAEPVKEQPKQADTKQPKTDEQPKRTRRTATAE